MVCDTSERKPRASNTEAIRVGWVSSSCSKRKSLDSFRMQREYILFPNYVFVQTEFKAEDFYKIKGINGVQRFLGNKTSPSTLTFLEEEWVKILNNDGHPLEPTEVTVDEDGNVIILKGILLKFKSRIKSFNKRQRKATFEITVCNEIKEITLSLNVIDTTKPTETNG